MLKVEIVILNANVLTLNPRQPKAEAIAIHDGKIVAVGSNEEICGHVDGKTKVIDAKNRMIVPGFVDCHTHMLGFGRSLQTLDLRNVKSIGEMQRKLSDYCRENPDKNWVLGEQWDQEKFAEKRYPNRWDLDAAVPHKPTFIIRVCGHLGVANSKALQLAGITRDTKVSDGKVCLDESKGEPNGILLENAMELVWRAIPKPSLEEIEETCLSACRKAAEVGLTGVHWIVESAEEVRALQRLSLRGKLPIRVYFGIPVELLDNLVSLGLLTGFGNGMVKIGFVKILADGSLGARTAALKAPYSDDPATSGKMLYTQRQLNKLFLRAHRAGLQLAVHAIGDRCMEMVLEAFEKSLREHPRENHRHRIEHCSVLNPGLIGRMKRLGLIASVQPHFVVSDFWVNDRVGRERARWVYPFRTLMREGVTVVSGSDYPVEPLNPILGIWAATNRSLVDENLTVEEALRTYTINAAYASFNEDKCGTIEVGKFADLTILSDDLFSIPPYKIRDVAVEMTIVDGKIVYTRSLAHA
ncbi:MAG: amidohydrolase [Candidatus Bathyarchaeia archaeon]